MLNNVFTQLSPILLIVVIREILEVHQLPFMWAFNQLSVYLQLHTRHNVIIGVIEMQMSVTGYLDRN